MKWTVSEFSEWSDIALGDWERCAPWCQVVRDDQEARCRVTFCHTGSDLLKRHIMRPYDETRDFRFVWSCMPCRQEIISWWVTNSFGAARACPLFWIGWALCPRTRVVSGNSLGYEFLVLQIIWTPIYSWMIFQLTGSQCTSLSFVENIWKKSYTGFQQDQPEIWFAHN